MSIYTSINTPESYRLKNHDTYFITLHNSYKSIKFYDFHNVRVINRATYKLLERKPAKKK